MKKTYETPSIEVVKFQYRDQVVAASGDIYTECNTGWKNLDTTGGSSDFGSCEMVSDSTRGH